MARMFKDFKEVAEVFEGLKISNQKKQIIIDDLIAEGIKKDELVHALKGRLEWMETQLREYQE